MTWYSKYKKIINTPALAILCAYMLGIFIGSILLWLPISTKKDISFIDAVFTSTSALCVTGLTVQDTGQCFTLFGQWIILLLIQLGGIGILTFSGFIIRMVSGRLGFEAKSWVEESLLQNHTPNIYYFLKKVLIFITLAELIGAFLLFFVFQAQYPWYQSIFLALFHSISAFCNAGFSLFSSNLEAYRGYWFINLVIMLLIILGGIGFVVVEDIRGCLKDRSHGLSFHTKIVLVTTGILILMGAVVMFFLEFSHSFQSLSCSEMILSSFFQSVSCRTAGFNTVAIGQLTSATLFVFILLMFIGGSPGSMAGGIKTTSFALLLAQIVSRLRARSLPELFHRTVSAKDMDRVFTLLTVTSMLVLFSVFVLLISESNTTYLKQCKEPFLTIVFEVVSAVGTVGLSMGLTPELSVFGKWLISLLMLIGRIGPLTLAIFLMSIQPELEYQYPGEEVMIG